MPKVKFLFLICLAFIVTFTATVRASDLGEKYKLEKVLILSRHNIRAPLVEKNSTLAEITPHKWYDWKEAAGDLSLRGGLEETSMGQYFQLARPTQAQFRATEQLIGAICGIYGINYSVVNLSQKIIFRLKAKSDFMPILINAR